MLHLRLIRKNGLYMKNIRFIILSFMFVFLYGNLHAEIDCFASEVVKQMPFYSYPYDNLHLQLKEKGIETIDIFSYGSLMDRQSASKTMSEKTLQTMRPAVAFGVKRLFNRDVPIKPNSKWGQPNNPQARGMLNVVPSDAKDVVNGVVFTVSVDEIPDLLYREEGYNLIPVVVQNWKESGHNYYAYTFSAQAPYTNDTIDPRPMYYELSRDASGRYDPAFYSLWFQTTFQSDGKTPIGEWEERVKNHDPLTQIESYSKLHE